MELSGTIITVPDGWRVEQYPDGSGTAYHEERDGFVRLSCYIPLPGIILTDIDLACPSLTAGNPVGPQLITVNWCSEGRCEVDFGPEGTETFRVLRPGGTFCGCFYVEGETDLTDWWIKHFHEPRGFFTPPYETAVSLEKRLKGMYSQVHVETVKSMACFTCVK